MKTRQPNADSGEKPNGHTSEEQTQKEVVMNLQMLQDKIKRQPEMYKKEFEA